MILLILIWAMDSITISAAMASMNQIFLLWGKYLCALPVVAFVVSRRQGLHLPKRKHLPRLLSSMIFGDILYFFVIVQSPIR